MPYQLPNHDAPFTPMPSSVPAFAAVTPEERELLGTNTAAVAERIAQLAPIIEGRARAAEAAASAAVTGSREYGVLRQAGAALARVALAHGAAVKGVRTNRSLTPAGQDEELARLRTATRGQVEQIANKVLSATGDQLLAAFPAHPFPLPAELAPTVAAIFASYPVVLPATLMAQAIEALQRASVEPTRTASGTTGERLDAIDGAAREAVKLNLLLAEAYLPILERGASAPQSHWAPFADLANRLAALITAHLDTVWKRQASRRAFDYVEAARRDFSWLVAVFEQQDEWDNVLSLGAPSFDWPRELQQLTPLASHAG